MRNLVLYNASVLTMDPLRPRARTVVIRDGIITRVCPGDPGPDDCNHDALSVDCQNKTVLPGFIDAHFHFRAFADRFITLDLSPRNHILSIGDMQRAIGEHAAETPAGTWIRAKGYDEFSLAERRQPDRWDLDAATTRHPVKLTHRTGHAHVLNTPALDQVGIGMASDEPPGGMMVRDLGSGEPTGLLYEMGGFLSERIPPMPKHRRAAGVKAANQALLQYGITTFHDMTASNGPEQWQMFADGQARGEMRSRVRFFMDIDAFLASFPGKGLNPFPATSRLALGGVKIILDESTGRLLPAQSVLNEMVREVHCSGYPVAIHAIEPNAVASACEAIEKALDDIPGPAPRHRIEHCSVCPPEVTERISRLGVVVVSQPPFVRHNGDRYLHCVDKEEIPDLYPFRRMLDKRIRLAAGSDCPVVPPNPFEGIQGAVSRRGLSGRLLMSGERISIEQALNMYTLSSAFSGCEEVRKGSISEGKLGDLVVLDRNMESSAADELEDICVDMTIIDGMIEWSR